MKSSTTEGKLVKIGIIVGSTRPNRVGDQVGQWIYARASARDDAEFELVDLLDYDVPLLAAPKPPMALQRDYADPRVSAWGAKMDEFDAYVLVTAEYNHSVPGVFKNAIDNLGPELWQKAAGLASYGAESGVRAVEHWRQILANWSMYVVRQQVSFSTNLEFRDGVFTPNERREGELKALLDQLIPAATAMARLRG